MSFDRKKFSITKNYIQKGPARSGQAIQTVAFIVAHDTGNPGSTASGNRDYFNYTQPSASAHTFIDDGTIMEMIPLREKAWHVRYNVKTDNQRFGKDANHAAIGVELCYGGNIDFKEAYKRYVWYHAYLCKKFGLNPQTDIVAHATLDPSRRTDPHNALNQYGIAFDDFIRDVTRELKEIPAKNKENNSVQEVPTDVKQIRIKDVKEIRIEGLHTYGSPNWEDKTGPIVEENYIFTVKRKLIVDDYPMYQLISGWYITAAEKYVEIYKKGK
ncbi:N-acetylmuramoyl-L-alanine amidase CwlA [Salinibacillus kushneri]|uniref:N-acetylmuramoyl-L-alanine amidase n=1 Tax=Salinibacillus kushneri TaxID=237682 RepID=A0A1H9YXE2_9BACI|nr:N-acetylmuramoyl-L-alanine amidase CwlA [Salinibacillus kushneri]